MQLFRSNHYIMMFIYHLGEEDLKNYENGFKQSLVLVLLFVRMNENLFIIYKWFEIVSFFEKDTNSIISLTDYCILFFTISIISEEE